MKFDAKLPKILKQMAISSHVGFRLGFPGGSAVMNLPANAGDTGQSPGQEEPLRRLWQPSPGFLPEKSHDRGAWWALVHGVAESQTRLSN